MRRVIARGRVFPQSYSTDRRMGRLSLKACALFPLLWANADDQGRLCGEPDEVKYTCCPNIDHITKADVTELLTELERNGLIKVYETPKSSAIQLLDWWQVQKPQWAYPSEYPPPKGWKDRLRYHPRPDQVITENWVPPSQWNRELPSELRNATQSAEAPPQGQLPSALGKKLRSQDKASPQSPLNETEKGKGNTKRGRGKVRSKLRSPPPSPVENELLEFISKLNNWKFDKADDFAWLREFRQEYPEFNLPLAKACRDYHSGRAPPQHKGHWKNRFREWIKHERQYQEERHGRAGEHRQDTQRDAKPHDWEELPEDADFAH